MKALTEKADAALGNRVVHQQCLACGHAWVDYEGQRSACVLCNSDQLSRPISLSRIREVTEQAQKQVATGQLAAADLEARKAILLRDYRKAAPVFAQRADETSAGRASRSSRRRQQHSLKRVFPRKKNRS